MNRRRFLRSIVGVAAATALPSEIWPFRKIFIPRAPELVYFDKPIPALFPPAVWMESDEWARAVFNGIPMFELMRAQGAVTATSIDAVRRSMFSRLAQWVDIDRVGYFQK